MANGKRSSVGRAVRFCGTLLCFALIAWKLDFAKLGERLANPRWTYLLLCVAITPCLIGGAVLRWWTLVRARGAQISYRSLLRIFLVGTFFNQFMPSTVGGDLFRIYGSGKRKLSPEIAAGSVIVDRLSGLFMIAFAAIAGWFVVSFTTGDPRWAIGGGVVLLGAAFGLWLLAGTGRFGKIRGLMRREHTGLFGTLVRTLAKWHGSVAEYRNHRGALAAATALSAVLVVIRVLNVWLAALAFQAGIPLPTLFLIVPSILLLGAMPISIGGWGLNELSTALLFKSAGLTDILGFSAAILIRIKNLGLALIGGILLWLPWKSKTSLEEKSPVAREKVSSETVA